MVLWGAIFNAVVVIGVVSLLLFRLPMAILWDIEIKLKSISCFLGAGSAI
jgi:hypothetical protein